MLNRTETRSKRNESPIGTLLGLAMIFALGLGTGQAQAQSPSGSELLLPYFEIDLDGAEMTTFFSVVNTSAYSIQVRASLYTNWGLPVLDTSFAMEAHEVQSVNLRRWLADGKLPDRQLDPKQIEHLAAAFSGQRSPSDDLFYSAEVTDDFGHLYAVATSSSRLSALPLRRS